MIHVRGLLGIEKADRLFLKGTESFSQKNYQNAFVLFKRADLAFARSRNMKMQINSCLNAALSAEQANIIPEATRYYYKAAKLRAIAEPPLPFKEIIDPLFKTLTNAVPSGHQLTSEVLVSTLLVCLAASDLPAARKAYEMRSKVKKDQNIKFMEEIWELLQARDAFVRNASLPRGKIVPEFRKAYEEAEKVVQAYSAVELKIGEVELPKNKDELAVKDDIVIPVSIEAFAAPIKITRLRLKTGKRGTSIKSTFSKEELFHKPEKREYKFTVQGQLPGEWEVGPATCLYTLEDLTFEVESETITLDLAPPEVFIDLEIEAEEIAEDYEYKLTINLENQGKGAADITLKLIRPDEVKIITGTGSKQILDFKPQQKFLYSIDLRFDSSSPQFEGQKLAAEVYEGENLLFTKNYIIGGKDIIKEEEDEEPIH
ncbi:MAG: hypothetical protein ACFFC7_19650 [Candidatus Hermodarchaeota archaeon]